MPICYITYGVPGCGKSTWRKSLDQSKFTVINLDTIRKDYPKVKPYEHWLLAEVLLAEAINSGKDIILDNTHIYGNIIDKWLSFLNRRHSTTTHSKFEYSVVLIYFDISLNECLRRNALRVGDELVPEKVVRNFHRGFKPLNVLKESYSFDDVVVIGE